MLHDTLVSLCLLLLCVGISVTYVFSLYVWQVMGFPPTADRDSPAVIVQRSASVTAASIVAALAVEGSRRSGLVSPQLWEAHKCSRFLEMRKERSSMLYGPSFKTLYHGLQAQQMQLCGEITSLPSVRISSAKWPCR